MDFDLGSLSGVFPRNVIGLIGGVIAFVYVVFHVLVVIKIAQDASVVSITGRLFPDSVLLWILGALFFGPMVVPFYWLMHHSTLKKE